MTRRKYTKKYNPWIGQNEKVLKSNYYKEPLSGKIRTNRRRTSMTESERKAAAISILLALIIFIIYKIFVWMSTHIIEGIILSILIIGGIILLITKVPKIKKFFSSKIKIYGPIKDEEIKSLIEVIEGIRIQDVRNEEDFEKQVYQRLDAKGFNPQRQVKIGESKKIDLVVQNNVGIELKIGDRAKNLQDLIGQVTIYKNHLRKIIVVILDVGVIADLREYSEYIKNVDEEKINVAVIKGNIRRYKKREEYILVKKETTQY